MRRRRSSFRGRRPTRRVFGRRRFSGRRRGGVRRRGPDRVGIRF